MAHFLTTESKLKCPHGGTVIPSTSNLKVKAGGAFVLRKDDTCTIAGCPYMRGTTPNPCMRVRWDTHAEHHSSHGARSLTRDSVGYCLDGTGATQGTVVVSSTQQRGGGT